MFADVKAWRMQSSERRRLLLLQLSVFHVSEELFLLAAFPLKEIFNNSERRKEKKKLNSIKLKTCRESVNAKQFLGGKLSLKVQVLNEEGFSLVLVVKRKPNDAQLMSKVSDN